MITLLALAAVIAAGYGIYAGSACGLWIAGMMVFFIMIDEFGYDEKKPSGHTR